MRALLLSILTALLFLTPFYGEAQGIVQTDTFSYTGAVQTFVVPGGVDSVTVDVWGGQGGRGYYNSNNYGVGGLGGRTQATIAVTPGSTLYVYVGGAGTNGQSSGPGAGGFNGGANGAQEGGSATAQRGGGGGGASDIRVGGTALANRVIVAGGGGGVGVGAATGSNGGAGGGLVGQGGTNCCSGVNPSGGTQSAGGSGGSYSGYCTASPGTLGSGGDACSPTGGGGGGGGYYGGGGGAWASGGGGSNYADGSAVNVTHTQGYNNNGNGFVSITYTSCSLPILPTTFTTNPLDRFHTITAVNVNGTGSNTTYVSPGETVSLSFNYSITNGGGSCPGCVTQTYVGIAGFWGTCVASYAGYCNCSNSYSTSFTAPTTPGAYYFTLGASWLFSCSATPVAYVPNTTNGFGAIVVRESFTTTGGDETCVGSLNGTATITPDNGTSGNSYLWSNSSTSNIITGLGAGDYYVTAADAYGCTQIDTVTINTDTTPPVAHAVASVTLALDGTGSATLTQAMADSASSDLCLESVTVSNAPLVTVDTNFTYLGTYGGHSYYLTSNSYTWLEAADYAASVGGELVTINNAGENSQLDTWLGPINSWLGYNDTATEGSFVWTSGSTSSYTAWSAGEPNNVGDEDCTQMLSNGLWNDLPCNANAIPFVVEIVDTLTFDSTLNFSCADVGTTKAFLKAEDAGGLTDIDTFNLTIVDNTPPSISASASSTLYLNSSGVQSIDPTDVSLSYSDNCGIDSVWSDAPSMFYCSDTSISYTVQFFVSDIHGNVDSVSVLVTVADSTSPQLTLNSLNLYLDGAGSTVLTDSTSYSSGTGYLYFTSTVGNRVYRAHLDSLGNTPTQLYAPIVSGSQGPVGIEYVPQNDSLYIGGGNYQEVVVAGIDGSFSRILPNSTPTGNEHHDVAIDFDNDRYFFTAGENGIFVANLDGTGVPTNIYNPASGSGVIGIDYHPATDEVFFTEVSEDEISKVGADGTGYTVLFDGTDNVDDPRQISIDHANGVLYWTNRPSGSLATSRIMTGNLDGSGSTSTLFAGTVGCYGIDVNEASGTVYWIAFNGGLDYVLRGSLDGTSGPDTLYSGNFNGLRGITSAATSPAGISYSDNCGVTQLSITPDSFTCADLGQNTITVTVSDSSGNLTTDTFSVWILDTVFPTANAKNLDAYLDASGAVVVSADSADSSSTDNCSMTFTLSDSTFGCSDVGANAVMFYATDAGGNVDSASITITVHDTVSPVVITQNITVQLDATGAATITPLDIDNGSSDACGIASMALDTALFSCADVGTPVTVNLTVTDSNGNAATASAVVTVQDTVAPTVLAQNITVQLDSASGSVSISADSIDAGSTDACGIASTSLNDSIFDCSDVGLPVQVVLTVVDANGNADTAHAYVTVQDVTAPTMVAFDSVTVYLNAAGSYSLTTAEVDNGSSDVCGVVLSLDTTNFDCSAVGTAQTVVLTGMDPSGNTSSVSAIIIVEDTVAPVVVTQNDTVFLDATGSASITPNDINNGSSDACGIDSLGLDISSFTCADYNQTITVTLYVEDVNGNSATNTATVTVLDALAPTAVAQNLTLHLDASGAASTTALAVDNGSTDNCGIQSRSLDITSFDCSDVGAPVQVVLTVTDSSGNSDTAHAYMTVLDTVAPTILVQNDTVLLDSNGTFTISSSYVDQGTNDACGISSLALSDSIFDCGQHGDTALITFTATDVNGNVNTAVVEIYVFDVIAPEMVTQDITLGLDVNGEASITPVMIDNGTNDACGIQSLSLDSTDFDCSEVGSNTVTLTAVDSNGNVNTATATVTVIDTIAPNIVVNNITIYLDASGQQSLTPAAVDGGTSDACGIDTLMIGQTDFDCGDGNQTYTLSFTAVDIHGNTSVDSFDVTILDTIKPTLITGNITVALDSSGEAGITPAMIDLGTWDSCGVASIGVSVDSFACAELGANTIEFYATDVYGNSDTTSVIVTVIDSQAPVVLAQNMTVYLDPNGQASITTLDIDNGSNDNCTIDTLWLDDYDFVCADTATPQTVTLFAQDQSGNVASATASVFVFDTLLPIVTTNDITVLLDSFGSASIVPSAIDSGSSDNCAIDTMWLSQYDFSCADVNNPVTVTLFIQDVSGNLDSATALVEVFDQIAPQPVVQNITIGLDSFGNRTIDSSFIDVGTWDSCGVQSLWLSQTVFDCSHIGPNTVTFFAEDIHGNVDSVDVTVTVEDVIAPTIVIIDTFAVWLDSSGVANVTADSIDLGTWDSCAAFTIDIDTSSFSCANHGDTLEVTFTAQDVYGNTSTDTCVFIIRDSIAPQILAHSDTVALDSNGQFVLSTSLLDDGTWDACGVDTMYLSDTLMTCAEVDTTVDIWYYAIDVFGNTDSIELTITIIDTIHPEIVCIDSIIQDNDIDQCGAIVSFNWPSASDNCSIDSIVQIDTTGLDTGSFFPVGITQLTYVAYDQSGNTDTCSVIIEVEDWQKPQLLCAPDTQICDTTFIFDYPDYVDNCSGFDVVQIAGIPSGDPYPVGATINRFAVMDSYGNADTCEYEVFRFDFPSLAVAGPDQEHCEQFTAEMAADSAEVGTGIWSIVQGDGSIADSLDPMTQISGIGVGYTYLEWRIENGVCPIERDTMFVREYVNPVAANAGVDIVVCDTNQTSLEAIMDTVGFGRWLPSTNAGIIADTTDPNSMVSNLSLGSYQYVWKVYNGVCPITFDTVQVDVVPYPVVDAGEDKFVFYPTSIPLIATSDLDVTYAWSPSFALASTSGDSVMATPDETTTYIVEATTEFGCVVTDSVSVFVNIGPVLPTAFTPDGDGYNDVWNLKELESYPDCMVKVYNRWGNLIFESDGYVETWDGTYRGEPLPSGSYFYVIELNVEEVPPQTGSVTIIKNTP